MPVLSRRSFLKASGAVPFLVWLQQQKACGQQPLLRYDAWSDKGKQMLKTYAKAVKAMRASSEKEPKSWVFQWYTHWVGPKNANLGAFDPQQKDQEINRIFPAADPARNLAMEMWDTCQAHGPGMNEDYFLPWHRLFVLYFEQIIRSVAQDDKFTLPYWNYSTTDQKFRGILPPEFRQKNDPVLASLYVEERNPGVNAGQAIQKNQTGDPLSLDTLGECIYQPHGADSGFCQSLDTGLHGNVHVLVGNTKNMGFVPWAAKDPIFWLHHCNIDRLWASWNAGNRANPTLSQQFIFADKDGKRVVANVSDVLDMNKLGYAYDQLEPVAKCSRTREFLLAAAQNQKAAATMKPESVKLGLTPVTVALDPQPLAEGQPANFAARVKSLGEAKRLFLVIKNLQIAEQPGILYDLYLDLPADAKEDKRKDYFVGSFSFFHAGHIGPKPMDHDAPAKAISFDITALAKKLHDQNLLREKPTVTIVPNGKPVEQAQPQIGDIRIVEQ